MGGPWWLDFDAVSVVLGVPPVERDEVDEDA